MDILLMYLYYYNTTTTTQHIALFFLFVLPHNEPFVALSRLLTRGSCSLSSDLFWFLFSGVTYGSVGVVWVLSAS